LLDNEKKKLLEAESNSTALVRKLDIFVCFCILTQLRYMYIGLNLVFVSSY
jgi:hypothetical protein